MSCTTSALAGRLYGVKLVCRTWEQPRSSYYGARQTQEQPVQSFSAGKRGPKTPLSDAVLLDLIRADLNTSPFQGEGHRKVWARLRVRDGVKVGRRRVLRLMRENNLLSPYRGRRGNPRLHEGEITTQVPNLMWGTDGARVFTVEEGWGWIFVAVEHWNAECVGWHVCKQGTRFAALEPISQGLISTLGSVAADAGRGLSLRMDHGTQYLSDHFQNQLKYWGISPSFAFIEQPQTNGVAERFIRTLKEQVIYGRVFQDLQEVREAVRHFVDTYNREWLVEKNSFKSPWQARAQWLAQASLARAA
jgi:transposase InsO family protein